MAAVFIFKPITCFELGVERCFERSVLFLTLRCKALLFTFKERRAFVKNNIVIADLLICLCFALASFSQDNIKPWEKYGLSQSEWKIIQDNKISLDKVPVLLSAGISIGEYSKKPWKKLWLTEGEWIEKRRAGLTAYDIELEVQSNRRQWKVDSKNVVPSEYSSFSSNKNRLVSLLLPGFQQLRLKEMSRGEIMAGLAIASLVGCFVVTVVEDRFEARPLCFVLAPDMLWSFIDFKITLGKMGKGSK